MIFQSILKIGEHQSPKTHNWSSIRFSKDDMLVEQPVSQHIIGRALVCQNALCWLTTSFPTHDSLRINLPKDDMLVDQLVF